MRNLFNSIVITFGVFIIFFIAGLLFAGCNKEDVKPFDLNLFDGNWEVVVSDDEDLFGRCFFLEIASDSNKKEGEGNVKSGIITTYLLTATGIKFYDKEYSWVIRETDKGDLLLSLKLEGELDSDEPWAGSYFFKITRLDNTHMWWQAYSNGSSCTIKMYRRTDIN